ncbi:MAG: PH domain-containing protein [Candidatus Dadabacteria bacterium]
MEPEITICEVTPSQVLNLKPFLYSIIALIAIIVIWSLTKFDYLLLAIALPLFYGFWKWLQVKATILKITSQRIIISEGVLNKRTNETELYRVRDSCIEEPFFFRLFGIGNIIVYTTDEADNVLRFKAYKKPHWLKDQVRNNAEICRQNKRWGNDNILIHEHAI